MAADPVNNLTLHFHYCCHHPHIAESPVEVQQEEEGVVAGAGVVHEACPVTAA